MRTARAVLLSRGALPSAHCLLFAPSCGGRTQPCVPSAGVASGGRKPRRPRGSGARYAGFELFFPESLPRGHQASCWRRGPECAAGEHLGVRSPSRAASCWSVLSLSLVLRPIPGLSPLHGHPLHTAGPLLSAALHGPRGSLHATWQPRTIPITAGFPFRGRRVLGRLRHRGLRRMQEVSALSCVLSGPWRCPQRSFPSPAERALHSPACWLAGGTFVSRPPSLS